MVKRVCVFTGTRAEFGLLSGLLKALKSDERYEPLLLVGGAHFSSEFGNTVNEILAQGFRIDGRIDVLEEPKDAVSITKMVGNTTISAAQELSRLSPEALLILGDRYEALALAQAALFFKIPVVHLHGGEKTEGAYDDSIRHAITKLSYLHFVAAEEYRKRVIQLGESPDRVFNVGAIGLDNVQAVNKLNLNELSSSLEITDLCKFFIVTYHPETLSVSPVEALFYQLTKALDRFPEHKIIFTYPNADEGGQAIVRLIEHYAECNPGRVHARASLGVQRYISAIHLADAVIGNSSSGIIEAPSCGTPSVNIGSRQKGRLAAKSVLHCEANTKAIFDAISKAINPKLLSQEHLFENPYWNGNVSEKILELMRDIPNIPTKRFFDLKHNGAACDNNNS